MKVIVVDDETSARNQLCKILSNFNHVKLLGSFGNPHTALEYLIQNPVDIVFLDIEMPEMTGVELAFELSQTPKVLKKPAIVFTTGHGSYTGAAWKVRAADYIMKPCTPHDAEEALERARRLHHTPTKIPGLQINCFPVLNVIVNGKPVNVRNKKAKEMLALLVHHRGAWVNIQTILAILFEDDAQKSRSYYNTLVLRLRQTLKAHNIENIIETENASCRINLDLCSCDYYRYLEGDTGLFNGEYLNEYSWAEPVAGMMMQQTGRYS